MDALLFTLSGEVELAEELQQREGVLQSEGLLLAEAKLHQRFVHFIHYSYGLFQTYPFLDT